MELCARCHKRVAVVYVTKIENGETVTEGICLKCAKELGIKPVNDILEKMGVSSDDIDEIADNIESLPGINGGPLDTTNSDDTNNDPNSPENGGAPAIDINKLFREFGLTNKKPDERADAGRRDPEQPREKTRQTQKPGSSKLKYLSTYCQNLNDKAKEGKLDSIVGRTRELDRVIQILSRRQKNNPCLIGEPGVGKTAIAEALAQKIEANDVPDKLRGKQIYLVDLTALVAGTQFRGQFESRILGLINEVKEQGNVILVIDEVHNIVGAGDAEGSMNAANILKPALSRGEIQVIGATTLDEYRKHIEKDSALERRFQPVMVNEPSIEDSVKILLGIKHYYEEFHEVKIPDDIARRAVILSERYITDRYLPDKAIDLIDEAAAHVALTSSVLHEYNETEGLLEAAKDERERLGQESDGDENSQDSVDRYQRIAELQTNELRLTEKLKELETEKKQIEVTADDLADVIEIWTGVPATTINENEFLRLDRLEARIKEHIIGQDKAVSAVVRAIKRGRAGVSYKRKPVSFIFAGPTGVGKTELVKTIASDLFNSPDALIRLDMSEYMEKHAVSKIIGSPPGYVGYDEAGQLTEKIRRHPYSVVLFDEIEKAHPDVLNILLQILDDGKITDSHGKVVNFENTILVMTTNAGSSTGSGMAGFGAGSGTMEENRTEKALSEFLRPEFINRIDEIITFRALEEPDFIEIARIMIKELGSALADKSIAVRCSEDALALIAKKAFSRKYGARNLRRFIQTEVEDKIAAEIISNYDKKLSAVSIDVDNDSLKFEYI